MSTKSLVGLHSAKDAKKMNKPKLKWKPWSVIEAQIKKDWGWPLAPTPELEKELAKEEKKSKMSIVTPGRPRTTLCG